MRMRKTQVAGQSQVVLTVMEKAVVGALGGKAPGEVSNSSILLQVMMVISS